MAARWFTRCVRPTWRQTVAAPIFGRSISQPEVLQPRRLTTHPEGDSSPEWTADGREIYFLSTRSGSSQVWRLPANGGEAIQVTDLPLDVGSFHVASAAGRLAVTLDVFADCNDLPCTVERLKETKNAKDSGEVFDRIFVRHWDTWSDGRISQLFALGLSNGVATEPSLGQQGARRRRAVQAVR